MFTAIPNQAIANAFFKLIGYSVIFLIADALQPSLFGSLWPLSITAIILTAIGTMADLLILPKFESLPSLLMGAPAMVLLIWWVPKLWPMTQVSVGAAIILALCIAPYEFFLHKYFLGEKTI